MRYFLGLFCFILSGFTPAFAFAQFEECYAKFPRLFSVEDLRNFDLPFDSTWVVELSGLEFEAPENAIVSCSPYLQADESGYAAVITALAQISSNEGNADAPWVELLDFADTRDNPFAALLLGDVYKLGIGVGVDEPRAFGYYRRAAGLGNMIAQHNVGAALFLGVGTNVDYAAAADAYAIAAARQFPKSAWSLARMYAYGEGVSPNGTLAFDLLTSVSAYPHYEIPHYGSWIAWHGVRPFFEDRDGARRMMQLMYDYIGGDGVIQVALMHMDGGEEPESFDYALAMIEVAANNGHSKARQTLTAFHTFAAGELYDAQDAEGLFRAAENGNYVASLYLAEIYYDNAPDVSAFFAAKAVQANMPGAMEYLIGHAIGGRTKMFVDLPDASIGLMALQVAVEKRWLGNEPAFEAPESWHNAITAYFNFVGIWTRTYPLEGGLLSFEDVIHFHELFEETVENPEFRSLVFNLNGDTMARYSCSFDTGICLFE